MESSGNNSAKLPHPRHILNGKPKDNYGKSNGFMNKKQIYLNSLHYNIGGF
jgi:hypothetical protein